MKLPRVIWQGAVDEQGYRVVQQAPDEGDQSGEPMLIIERIAEDALGVQHWTGDDIDVDLWRLLSIAAVHLFDRSLPKPPF